MQNRVGNNFKRAKEIFISLIIASQEGHSRSVEALIKNGIDPIKTIGHGATAIYYPEQQGLKSCRNNLGNWISFESKPFQKLSYLRIQLHVL